jgi:hypothetical protein
MLLQRANTNKAVITRQSQDFGLPDTLGSRT